MRRPVDIDGPCCPKPVYFGLLFNMHKIVAELISLNHAELPRVKESKTVLLDFFCSPRSRDSWIIMRNHILSISQASTTENKEDAVHFS